MYEKWTESFKEVEIEDDILETNTAWEDAFMRGEQQARDEFTEGE